MPIEVDTTRAPRLLRYKYTGDFPSVEEQSRLRDSLISFGYLTADSVAIMDTRGLAEVPDDDALARTVAAALQRGGWPKRRAYVINLPMHLHMIQQFQDRR